MSIGIFFASKAPQQSCGYSFGAQNEIQLIASPLRNRNVVFITKNDYKRIIWETVKCSPKGSNQRPFAILMESCSQTFQKHPVLQQHSLSLMVHSPWQTVCTGFCASTPPWFTNVLKMVGQCAATVVYCQHISDSLLSVVCNLSDYWRSFQMHEHLWAVCKLYTSRILNCTCNICSTSIWV